MNEESNMMEGEILEEENLSEPTQKPPTITIPKKTLPKIDTAALKTKIPAFKKPKLITVAILFILLIFSFSLLIVLGVKRPKEDIVSPDIVITSPKPNIGQVKEESEIEKNLRIYEEKVNGLNTSIKNYPPPRLDLDVKF